MRAVHFAAAVRRARAFTVVELLVVLTIVAIVVAIAAPNFTATLARGRTAEAAQNLQIALTTARAEALRRGAAVSVCRSTNPTAATPTCGTAASGSFSANDWAVGWVAFVDVNGNGALDPPDTVLLVQPALSSGANRRAWIEATAIGGAAPGVVSFGADGLRPSGGAIANVGFAISDKVSGGSGQAPRCLAVGAAGQLSLVEGECPSGTSS